MRSKPPERPPSPEARLEDLKQQLIQLAAETLNDLATMRAAIGTFNADATRARERLAEDLYRRVKDAHIRIATFEHRTLWQRLRWIVRGH